jgi:TPR repeat protein
MNCIRSIFLAVVLNFSSGSVVTAQDFELGMAAYQSADYATALQEWLPLAEQGSAGAQYNLGIMYVAGQGVSKDVAEAVRWYQLAAEQGAADAQFNVGIAYRSGLGVLQDAAEAGRWFRFSAEQGMPVAQFVLGDMYEYGEGVPQSNAEAERWYRAAAVQGYAEAQMNLGSMYDNGKAVIQENGETVKWEGLSSDQETAGERTRLFSSAANILKDTVSAHMWWSISSTNGNPNAASLLERVEGEMTISQIAEATQRAKACMASDYQDCD